ncbi:site-specific integrase [Halorhodospira halophila]|uniref:site-specific integrase n=1 Tax=Halorhodospira halophila TaxID=1053 RepID=UPI001911EB09|nr:site-specific integrase [Halorhodospira halophila]MBK5942681.1 site-specific integrase [Halorhodospira halophila]
MASVRERKGYLFFDFRYKGVRCREYTRLKDTRANRKRMEQVLRKIEAEIELGTFDYAAYFPSSPRANKFAAASQESASSVQAVTAGRTAEAGEETPTFSTFVEEWLHQYEVTWKPSYQDKVRDILNKHLLPAFGQKRVGDFTKGELLDYRAKLAKAPSDSQRRALSPSRVNQVMALLRQILAEAADRYEVTNPAEAIKPLRQGRTEIDPLSLEEVKRFLETVDATYREYFLVRFFTGLRTSEIDGLRWRYVDLERKQIHVRETLVKGRHAESTKTTASERYIDMSSQVEAALRKQYERTGGDERAFVFQSPKGGPIQYNNLSNRVWYPTLEAVGLRRRRPYQTRHTAATLWLASGESPEWIARQMGHSDTKMLFTVYSRYVPNLTRRDGSAIERLLAAELGPAETAGMVLGDDDEEEA